jgi:hypothetical protein
VARAVISTLDHDHHLEPAQRDEVWIRTLAIQSLPGARLRRRRTWTSDFLAAGSGGIGDSNRDGNAEEYEGAITA